MTVLAALACQACVSSAELDFPVVEGARSIILIFQTGEQPVASAHPVDHIPRSLTLPRSGASLLALFYAEELEALYLQPGPLALVEEGSLLPPPLIGFDATYQRDQRPRFTALDAAETAPLFLATRLEDDVVECVDRGGCYPYPNTICAPCGLADAPIAPDPPEPPRFLPCPQGWYPITAGQADACDPRAPSGCAQHSTWTPGQTSCAPITVPCPIDQFPAGLDGPGVWFVRPDGDDDATGRRDDPLASLAGALSKATSGSTIALSRGEHAGANVAISVVIAGACHETVLGAVEIASGASRLRDVTLRDPQRPALRVRAAARLRAERIEILDSGGGVAALQVIGRLDGSDLVIRNGNLHALTVVAGGIATLDRVELDTSMHSAVIVTEDSRLRLTRAWIHGAGYHSIHAINGSALEVELALFSEGARGIAVQDAATATVSDVVMRGLPEGTIYASNGDLQLMRAFVDGGLGMNIGERARIGVEDLVMIGTSTPGASFFSTQRASSTFDRLYISEPKGNGITLIDGSAASFTDLIVERATEGPAIAASSGASFRRARIVGSRMAGIGTEIGRVALFDVEVIAVGLAAIVARSEVTAERIRIEGARGAGMQVEGPGSITARDVSISAIEQVEPGDCFAEATECGTCLISEEGGRMELARFRATSCTYAGAAVGLDAEMDLSNGAISSNRVGVRADRPSFDVRRLLRDVDVRNNDEPVFRLSGD